MEIDKAPAHEPILTLLGCAQSCIITGGNTGIGYATAAAMMRRGCHVILACRNMQKAEAAVQARQTLKTKPSPCCMFVPAYNLCRFNGASDCRYITTGMLLRIEPAQPSSAQSSMSKSWVDLLLSHTVLSC